MLIVIESYILDKIEEFLSKEIYVMRIIRATGEYGTMIRQYLIEIYNENKSSPSPLYDSANTFFS